MNSILIARHHARADVEPHLGLLHLWHQWERSVKIVKAVAQVYSRPRAVHLRPKIEAKASRKLLWYSATPRSIPPNTFQTPSTVIVLLFSRHWTMAQNAYYKVKFFCMLTELSYPALGYTLASHTLMHC